MTEPVRRPPTPAHRPEPRILWLSPPEERAALHALGARVARISDEVAQFLAVETDDASDHR